MLVQLLELFLEIQVARLVIIYSQKVRFFSHFAVVSAVKFEDVAERFLPFDIDIVQLLDKGKRGLEITLERQHLLLVLKAHHGLLCGEIHVLKRFLISDRKISHRGVKLVERNAWHIRQVIVSVSPLVVVVTPATEHSECRHGLAETFAQ